VRHEDSAVEHLGDEGPTAVNQTQGMVSRLALQFALQNLGGQIGFECLARKAPRPSAVQEQVRGNTQAALDHGLRQQRMQLDRLLRIR
jgi:hypothetical protein